MNPFENDRPAVPERIATDPARQTIDSFKP